MKKKNYFVFYVILQIVIISAFISFSSCTDAVSGKWRNLGKPATIELYSGGKLVGTFRSTGKVKSEQGSDGYFFKDAISGKFKEVSGDIVITYDN